MDRDNAMKSSRIYVRYRGIRVVISVLRREAGPEHIFFIHGLGCAKEAFDGAFVAPELQKYSLLAADLVGFGNSSKPEGFSYRMEEHADILKALLEEAGVDKVHIVAHSMGGAVGIFLAGKAYGFIESFANVEGNLVAEDCGLMSRRCASVSYEDFSCRIFDDMKAALERSCHNEVRLWLRKSAPLAFYRSSVSLLRWSESGNLLNKFKKLQSRKLYVYGEQSGKLAVLDRLGSVPRRRIPGSGHFVMLDNPCKFYREIALHAAYKGAAG